MICRPVFDRDNPARRQDDDRARFGGDCLRVVGREIIEHHEIIDDF